MISVRRVGLALLAAAASSCGGGDGIAVTTHVFSVEVLPSSVSILPNTTAQMTATPRDAQGNTMTGLPVVWASNNNAVATVTAGVVAGVSAGQAGITATIGGVSGTATVTVAPPTFALTVTGAGTGSGTVTSSPGGITCTITPSSVSGSCSASYNSGTLVVLTAAPATGNTFAGWAGSVCGTTPSCGITMSGARTMTATFTATSYAITTGSSPANSGTTSGGGTFTANSSVTVTATANAGFSFVSWTENGTQVSTSAAYTFSATANRTLVANFTAASVALTVTGNGTGNGTVTAPAIGTIGAFTCTLVGAGGVCTGTYPTGTVVTLTASPAGGSTFTGWSGACAGTSTCALTMSQARAVTATFTASAGAPTISSVSPSSPIGSTSAQPFTINGSNFVTGANITLRDVTTGEVFPNRPASSFASTQIVINPVFGTAAGSWSVQVINPNGQASNTFAFQVQATADPCVPLALAIPSTVGGNIAANTTCLVAGDPSVVYRFAATGSGVLQFTLTPAPALDPEIAVRTDPPGDFFRFANGPGASITGDYLLPAGSFLFSVSAQNGSSGTYTLNTVSTTTTLSPGCRIRTILDLNVTYNGQALASTDCLRSDGSSRTNTYYDLYYIYSTRPCTITMRSTTFDTFLSLRNVFTGAEVMSDDDSGGGTDSQIALAACNANGNVLAIWANSFDQLATGNYTLQLSFPASVRASEHSAANTSVTVPRIGVIKPPPR